MPVKKKSEPKEAPLKRGASIAVPSSDYARLRVSIQGITPLVSNRFAKDQQERIKDKVTGKAVKSNRGARDLELAAEGSRYTIPGGKSEIPAHPASAIMQAMIDGHGAGYSYTAKAIKQGFRFLTEFMPISTTKYRVREDFLKNANKQPDLRVRYEYTEWSASFEIMLYPNKLSPSQFAQALKNAGEFVGIGPKYMREWFGFGRFKIISITNI